MRRCSTLLTVLGILIVCGGLMFGWSKKPNSERPSVVPSLQSISFDTTQLRHDRDEQERRVWFTSDGDGVGLYVFNKPPDLPAGLQSVEQLQRSYEAPLANSPVKLVEVSTLELGGCKAVRLILKSPQQPHGMTYLGSFTIPFRDFSFVIKVQCAERGMTGMREAVLFEKLMAAGKIALTEPPHISGDWHPDDEKYDADFREHPLSRLRRVLKTIEQSCAIDPAVRSQPGFPLPAVTR